MDWRVASSYNTWLPWVSAASVAGGRVLACPRLPDGGKEEKQSRDESQPGETPAPSLHRLFSSFPPSESLEQAIGTQAEMLSESQLSSHGKLTCDENSLSSKNCLEPRVPPDADLDSEFEFVPDSRECWPVSPHGGGGGSSNPRTGPRSGGVTWREGTRSTKGFLFQEWPHGTTLRVRNIHNEDARWFPLMCPPPSPLPGGRLQGVMGGGGGGGVFGTHLSGGVVPFADLCYWTRKSPGLPVGPLGFSNRLASSCILSLIFMIATAPHRSCSEISACDFGLQTWTQVQLRAPAMLLFCGTHHVSQYKVNAWAVLHKGKRPTKLLRAVSSPADPPADNWSHQRLTLVSGCARWLSKNHHQARTRRTTAKRLLLVDGQVASY